ncbi:4'-phosphopantetheinyl transferase family protein [Marinoscillum pacificum]|uniref:4'-phosphopantetheinyl transferase family protein n=1 Tax=Marinoscillum pacificum TaxID=392723 RepID=UPI0021578AD9|nr:4'-phosphopantetheinyl transferase family protein [Marinoscillum pacificum]
MPLLLSKQISPCAAYAVWNIQETNQVLLSMVDEEIPTNMNPTRLAEWIVGRILIKSLCAQFGIDYQGVAARETGKPHLIGTDVEISISHSFPMAAAMIHKESPCGIDLERMRSKLIRIQDKFVNDTETAYLNNLEKLCAIWCGKEALYKIYGRKKLSMKDETFIEFESDEIMNGLIKKDGDEQRYRIHYEAVKDYYLAYSI